MESGTIEVNETKTLESGLNALNEFQAKVDAATWLIKDPIMAKVRHINLHLIRLCAKLADMCHKWEHESIGNHLANDDISTLDVEIMERIIADFIIHAAQLNKIMGTNLFNVYAQQIKRNLAKYAPDSELLSN